MFRAGLYARVSTNDQQTQAMQHRAMREYAARRGWMIAVEVREVNSGDGDGNGGRSCWKPPAAGTSMSYWSGGLNGGTGR